MSFNKFITGPGFIIRRRVEWVRHTTVNYICFLLWVSIFLAVAVRVVGPKIAQNLRKDRNHVFTDLSCLTRQQHTTDCSPALDDWDAPEMHCCSCSAGSWDRIEHLYAVPSPVYITRISSIVVLTCCLYCVSQTFAHRKTCLQNAGGGAAGVWQEICEKWKSLSKPSFAALLLGI